LRVTGGVSTIILSPEHGYALSGIVYKQRHLSSSGVFPTFEVLDREGKRAALPCTDPGWTVGTRVDGPNSVTVRYNRPEMTLEVSYEATPERLQIATEIIAERDLRLIAVSDGGGLLALPVDSPKATAGRLVVPAWQGQEIAFADTAKPVVWTHEPDGRSWPCNFVGLTYDGIGLILHPQHHAVTFSYGEGVIGGESAHGGENALIAGCTQFFRPMKTREYRTLPAATRRSIEITFAADANHDGQVDWVDIGLAYRQRYIRPGAGMNGDLYDGVVGATAETAPAAFRAVDFAPQTWWLSGGLTGGLADLQPLRPYLDLKLAGPRMGLAVGPQDDLGTIPADASLTSDDACIGPDGKPVTTATGAMLRAFPRAVASGHIWTMIDDRLRCFGAHKGDPWSIDGLAGALREDYRPEAPATFEEDFQARRKVLAYLQAKGLSIACDGLLEGLQEFCDYSRHTPYQDPSALKDQPQVHCVPLLATMFLGNIALGCPSHIAAGDKDAATDAGQALLNGMRLHTEGEKLPLADAADCYFREDLLWRLVSGLEIVNARESHGIWTVTYSDESSLTVDTLTNDYRLRRGDAMYSAGLSPTSPWGFVGLWNPGATLQSAEESVQVTRKLYVPRILGGDPSAVTAFSPNGSAEVRCSVMGNSTKVLRQLPITLRVIRPVTVQCTSLEPGRAALVIQSAAPQTVTICCDKPTAWFEATGQSISLAASSVDLAVNGATAITVAIPQ
jgi:hypothetical protein